MRIRANIQWWMRSLSIDEEGWIEVRFLELDMDKNEEGSRSRMFTDYCGDQCCHCCTLTETKDTLRGLNIYQTYYLVIKETHVNSVLRQNVA